MMPPKDISANRKTLTLEDKINLLSHYKETKCSIRKLAKHFNIGKTQAGLIIKQESKLYEQWLSGGPVNMRKRLGTVGFEIDKKMYDWFLSKKKENIDVTGTALQNKALELAKEMGYDSFKASNGWLSKFVKRHGITFKGFKNQNQLKSKSKERIDNLVNSDSWSKILSSVIDNYSEDDIFCAVQTGLFFRSSPDDITYLLDKTCADGLLSSERLTVLLCTSMSGNKEKPLVISDVPKNDIGNLTLDCQVDCKSNSFSWLTKNIINEWLTDFDNRMLKQEKKIVLFLDHSLPCHDCRLSNIRTIYFPSRYYNNQRINQGIIQDFKIIYRSHMLKHIIALKQKDINSSLLKHISVPQALMWIYSSWKELNLSVIHKCFEEFLFNVIFDVGDDEASVTLNDISDLLYACDSLTNAVDFVSIDECLVTEGEDPKAVEILVDVDVYTGSDEEIVNESENVTNNNDINFYLKSLKGLQQLEQFYLSQNDSEGALLAKQLITHNEKMINSKSIQSS